MQVNLMVTNLLYSRQQKENWQNLVSSCLECLYRKVTMIQSNAAYPSATDDWDTLTPSVAQCLVPCQSFSPRLISSWMTCSSWPSYFSISSLFNFLSQNPMSISWSIGEFSLGPGISLSTGVQVFSGGVHSEFGGDQSCFFGSHCEFGGTYFLGRSEREEKVVNFRS